MAEYTMIHGDCLEVMRAMPANLASSVICDPPYGLAPRTKGKAKGGFMGKEWDAVVPGVEFWKAALRIAKPGAILMAFGGARTQHRLACAIEDAGWELRDVFMWLFGSSMPKGIDISKKLDQIAGAEREVVGTGQSESARSVLNMANYPETLGGGYDITAPATTLAQQWHGWNSGTKPMYEPILVAMKPLDGSFAHNAVRWGVAGYNVGGSRIGTERTATYGRRNGTGTSLEWSKYESPDGFQGETHEGRYPGNVAMDESVARVLDAQTGISKSSGGVIKRAGAQIRQLEGRTDRPAVIPDGQGYTDSGGASRFFRVIESDEDETRFLYAAKTSKRERQHGLGEGESNGHPTLKPIKVMRWLCRLTNTPTGGVVFDPFAGSGSTGVGALLEGREFIGIELNREYYDIAVKRLEQAVKDAP